MPLKPPIPISTLKEMTARAVPGSAEWILLWEIRRHHILLRRVAQFLHGENNFANPVHRKLVEELNAEEAVQDWCAAHRFGIPLGQPVPRELYEREYQESINQVPSTWRKI